MGAPTRISGWRIIRISAAVLGLIVIGSFWWVRAVANEQWDRMNVRIAELEAERQAESQTRPVLREKAEPGNAWTAYGSALISAPPLPRTRPIALYFHPAPLDPASTATLTSLELWAKPCDAALERLRSGTRLADVRPTIVWEHRFTPLVLETDRAWAGMWSLSRAGVVRAHVMIDRGQSDEAVQLMMDLCQFGRDALQATDLDACKIGIDVLDFVIWEYRKLMKARALPQTALLRLDRELEFLDQNWPSGKATLRNQLLAFGKGCREEAERGSLMYTCWQPRSFRSWRWGYSARFRAASTFLRGDLVVRLLTQEAEGRAPERNSFTSMGAIFEWPEPVLQEAFRHYTSADPARGQLATLRVLRIAAHFQATGEVLDLPDPYGDRLKTVVKDGKLRVWSIGADRIDQGGIEGWTYSRDILLEVDR